MELEKIIKKCRKNDRMAQRKLFDDYSDRFFLLSQSYTKDRFLSEDAIAKAFLKIFNSLQNFKYENDSKFIGWMRRIVINESLMEIRKKKQTPLFTSEDAGLKSEEKTESGILYDDILKLLETLPEGYRLIFKLYVIEGYTHVDIAQMLNISEGTSKSQLHKARTQLQQLLIKNEIDYD